MRSRWALHSSNSTWKRRGAPYETASHYMEPLVKLPRLAERNLEAITWLLLGNLVTRRVQYPIFKVSGPKYHTLNGIWDQRP